MPRFSGGDEKETNSWKWTMFGVAYTLILALIAGVIVYNVGRALA